MKVVVSGGTGYIGKQILSQCLDHPSITSVLILTRRDPGNLTAGNPKAKLIVVEDFASYDVNTINELKTADAALWCLGTSHGDERVDIEFPLAFINVIKAHRPSSGLDHPFRYVQLSGALTEPPPNDGGNERSLWFFANGRRVRGAMETKVLEMTDDGPESLFTVYIVKPGGVLHNTGVGAAVAKCLLGDSLTIRGNELGAVMVDLAVHGNNEQKVFNNQDIINKGRHLLKTITTIT